MTPCSIGGIERPNMSETFRFVPGMILPSGEQHEVGVDELFFSTTDAKGVIEEANSVFVRLSRWPREQLIGAAHNIIRHQMMPGGAFRLMWQTLESGRPFAAYVHNLANNGSRYDVFATITPLDDGYLSVRTRPMCPVPFGAAEQIYKEALAVEMIAKADGANRHEAATVGAEKLAELLNAAGFNSYEDFMLETLPAEIEAREKAGHVMPECNAEGVYGEMLQTVGQLHQQLGVAMSDLQNLKDQSTQLQEASDVLRGILEATNEVSEAVNQLPSDSIEKRTLTMPLTLWSSMDAEIRGLTDELTETLKETSSTASHTRFRIALARLHATMIGNFVAELVTDPTASEITSNIGLLTRAISQAIQELNEQASNYSQQSKKATDNARQVAGLLQMLVDLLGSWVAGNEGRELPAEVADIAPKISEQVERSKQVIEKLESISGPSELPDADQMNQTVEAMRQIASQF